jgi:hypothetical protein
VSFSIRFLSARKIDDILGTDMPRLITETSRPTVTSINRACNELKVVILTQSEFKIVQTGFSARSGVLWYIHSN